MVVMVMGPAEIMLSQAVANLRRQQGIDGITWSGTVTVYVSPLSNESPNIVDIVVERESQKGMVIGKGGRILKEVGQLARAQLPDGVYLELRVKVDKDWQRRPDRVERLGY
jgi:GTP-binding protein Era